MDVVAAAAVPIGVAGGLYAVVLAVEERDIGEYHVVHLCPRASIAVFVNKSVNVFAVFVVAVDLLVSKETFLVFVEERLAAPVRVGPTGLVIGHVVVVHRAAGEVPPRHLRAAALVLRVEVDVVAADYLLIACIGVARRKPDDLYVVGALALLKCFRVLVGNCPAEDVGGGVCVPVSGGTVLHVTLKTGDGRHVARRVGYHDVAVAAHYRPPAGHARARAKCARLGGVKHTVVVVIAVVRTGAACAGAACAGAACVAAAGLCVYFVAAEHIVLAGVHLAHLVVPDGYLVGGVTYLYPVVVNVGMEREDVLGRREVGNVAVEVGGHFRISCRVAGLRDNRA